MTTQITGGVLGHKAVSLAEFDEFMDWLVDQDANTDPQALYQVVAWTFWCANLRANSVAQIPYAVYSEELKEKEQTEDNQAEWDIDLAPISWLVEMWLELHGAAYVLKRPNRVKLVDLQVLNANTMKVDKETVGPDGPRFFIQKVGVDERRYPAEKIVYFQTFSPDHDYGPGVSAGDVGVSPGSLIKNANQWATAFFGNGAIPAVFLTTEGTVPPVEKDRIQTRWEKRLRGVQKAWKTLVLERGLKPTVIGQPVKDLAMPALEKTKREQILAAHLIPPGLAESKTNRAERDALQYEFWTQTIKPLAEVHLQPTWNKQLFNPMGLRLFYQINKVEAIEREEIKKAESLSFIVNDAMLPCYQANLVKPDEVRRVLNELLLATDLPGLDEQFEPEDRITPMVEAQAAAQSEQGRPQRPGENPPKAVAPGWGRHRVSLPN